MTQSTCRQLWADQAQYFLENGNPGSRFTPNLTRLWDEQVAGFEELAKTSTSAHCQNNAVARARRHLQRTESIIFALYKYDTASILERAESDLQHGIESRGTHVSTDVQLQTAFATLRTLAPQIERSLAPEVAMVDNSSPDDHGGTKEALKALRKRAAAETAFGRFNVALATIAEYELDEE